MSLDRGLQRLWYGPAWLSLPLWPLGWLFGLLVALRGALYRVGLLRTRRVDVPVIVVGNITVGGTGKTPIAGWVAKQVARRGHRVGVVLRGYGGSHSGKPRVVTPETDAAEVGDEAIVHAMARPHVVVIGADRVAAARLAGQEGAEVVVCDDGLQHRRLHRDVEIAVVDGVRGLGNRQMLPAGPLREPPSRLESVNAVVTTERGAGIARETRLAGPYSASARLTLGDVVNVRSGERRSLDAFRGREVQAVAGIGNPGQFFEGLRAAGLTIREHALPDHARIEPGALPGADEATVLMTLKDAVKCRDYAEPDWWYVELDVAMDRSSGAELLGIILDRTGLTGAGVRLG
jgi:tetraacyldisaccharide 4'-kinase